MTDQDNIPNIPGNPGDGNGDDHGDRLRRNAGLRRRAPRLPDQDDRPNERISERTNERPYDSDRQPPRQSANSRPNNQNRPNNRIGRPQNRTQNQTQHQAQSSNQQPLKRVDNRRSGSPNIDPSIDPNARPFDARGADNRGTGNRNPENRSADGRTIDRRGIDHRGRMNRDNNRIAGGQNQPNRNNQGGQQNSQRNQQNSQNQQNNPYRNPRYQDQPAQPRGLTPGQRTNGQNQDRRTNPLTGRPVNNQMQRINDLRRRWQEGQDTPDDPNAPSVDRNRYQRGQNQGNGNQQNGQNNNRIIRRDSRNFRRPNDNPDNNPDDIRATISARRKITPVEPDMIDEFENSYYSDLENEFDENEEGVDYGGDFYSEGRPQKSLDGAIAKYETPPDALIIPSPTPPIKARRGSDAEQTPTWFKQRFLSALRETPENTGRLTRGYQYAANGSVTVLEISGGSAYARVQGSSPRPYKSLITLKPFTDDQWAKLYRAMRREAKYLAALTANDLPVETDSLFQQVVGASLFPASPAELKYACNCPDDGSPCKHAAAVFYILAEEIDRDPLVMFHLRGSSRKEALDILSLSEAESAARRLDTNLNNFYGLNAAIPELPMPDLSAVPLGAQLGDDVSEDLREEVADFYRAAAQLGAVHLMADFWLKPQIQRTMNRNRGR